MACVDELHVDDEGTSLEFRINECGPDGSSSIVDISSASSMVVRFQKPDAAKTTIDKTASIYTGGTNGDGTDGIIQYITEAGFIDTKGKWKAQAIVSFTASGPFHSSIVEIMVEKNLSVPL